MKLCYQDTSYSCSSVTSINQNREKVKTKQPSFGQNYQRRRPLYQPLQETLDFVYRGIAYQTGETRDFCPNQSSQVETSPFVQKLMTELGI